MHLSEMTGPHLDHALAKLRAQDATLCRMLAGVEPEMAKTFRKAMAAWAPAFTLDEMLERTRRWIALLEAEQERRKNISWEPYLRSEKKLY
jgi:2-keto-4-pentenoate hydratase